MNNCASAHVRQYSAPAKRGIWVSVTREFSRNLKRLIERRGLEDKAIAKLVGVTPSRFSNWKNGHHLPKPPQWDKLADILNCRYEDFLLPEGAESENFDDLIEDLDDLNTRFKRRQKKRR
jgi:transcriptional regulator with XRE-family HTH domain